jgi:hypothetical protein
MIRAVSCNCAGTPAESQLRFCHRLPGQTKYPRERCAYFISFDEALLIES